MVVMTMTAGLAELTGAKRVWRMALGSRYSMVAAKEYLLRSISSINSINSINYRIHITKRIQKWVRSQLLDFLTAADRANPDPVKRIAG